MDGRTNGPGHWTCYAVPVVSDLSHPDRQMGEVMPSSLVVLWAPVYPPACVLMLCQVVADPVSVVFVMRGTLDLSMSRRVTTCACKLVNLPSSVGQGLECRVCLFGVAMETVCNLEHLDRISPGSCVVVPSLSEYTFRDAVWSCNLGRCRRWMCVYVRFWLSCTGRNQQDRYHNSQLPLA